MPASGFSLLFPVLCLFPTTKTFDLPLLLVLFQAYQTSKPRDAFFDLLCALCRLGCCPVFCDLVQFVPIRRNPYADRIGRNCDNLQERLSLEQRRNFCLPSLAA
jgi:hypothetical protein